MDVQERIETTNDEDTGAIYQMMADLRRLEEVHASLLERHYLQNAGQTHLIVWRGEDYVTCLRLADNRFLSFAEYRAYIPEIVRAMGAKK